MAQFDISTESNSIMTKSLQLMTLCVWLPMIIVEGLLVNFIPGKNCGINNAIRVVDKPESDDIGCLIVKDAKEYQRIMRKRLEEMGIQKQYFVFHFCNIV